MQNRPLASLEELRQARTIKFKYEQEGLSREGFLLFFEGQVKAFENVCRHIPITLDYGDNRFFSTDGKHLLCQTHGALYEPLTGYCIAGPCAGASLKPLQVELRDGFVYLIDPSPPV